MSIYDFTVTCTKGEEVSLKNYAGKVLLIVNTATECGFTPEYEGLEALYKKYQAQGLEILDFPCNQFGGQAPGTDAEISQFCSLKYGTTFPRFKKIEVNGEGATPLYKYLKEQKGFAGFDPTHKITPILEDILSKADPNYKDCPSIKWNFTKFLVGKDGNVIARFEPSTSMAVIEEAIQKAL